MIVRSQTKRAFTRSFWVNPPPEPKEKYDMFLTFRARSESPEITKGLRGAVKRARVGEYMLDKLIYENLKSEAEVRKDKL